MLVEVPDSAVSGKIQLVGADGAASDPSRQVVRVLHAADTTGGTQIGAKPDPGATRDPATGSQPAKGSFPWPVIGPITSPYCEQRAWESCHPGIDIGVGSGTPIHVVAAGRVIIASSQGGYGNFTCVAHVTVSTCYAHQSQILVSVGERVSRGEVIGRTGCTGRCYGAHLHFEVRSTDLSPNVWFPYVRDRGWVESNYLVPSQFVRAHRSDRHENEPGIIVAPTTAPQDHGTFTRSDTPNWLTSPYGWNGAALYTYASPQEEEWAEWTPKLPATGQYEVQAWIPGYHATTRQARYQVTHDGGQTEVVVNQNDVADAWVSLGRYPFTPDNARVRLSDNTGEADSARLEVGFDAVRWLPL